MRIWIVVVVAAALLVPMVRASAQAPAPDALMAAKELVVVMKSADQFKSLFPLILQQLKGTLVQGRPEVAKDFDAIQPMMIELVNKRAAELVDAIAVVYAQNFTASELRDITAFYHMPTGQKLIEKTPAIAQQSMFVGQKFGESLMGDLRPRIIEELRKRGHNI